MKLRALPELGGGASEDPVGRAELAQYPYRLAGSLERVGAPDVLELAELALELQQLHQRALDRARRRAACRNSVHHVPCWTLALGAARQSPSGVSRE